jgi:hypothetical protein
MAIHQVVSANWINEHQGRMIRRIADIALTAIDDETEALSMELTDTCQEFIDTDCEKCHDTREKITDQILKAVMEQMLGVDS